MLIRSERAGDFSEIYALVKSAFATARVSDGNEQDFINQLRASDKYIPQLALVLEDKGRIIGQVMFTRTTVNNGVTVFPALLLAPLAVLLEYRNLGIGSQLVRHGLEKAVQMGFDLVFLVGDIAFYSRLGFKPAIDYGITCNVAIAKKFIRNVMVCELKPNALQRTSGVVDFIIQASNRA